MMPRSNTSHYICAPKVNPAAYRRNSLFTLKSNASANRNQTALSRNESSKCSKRAHIKLKQKPDLQSLIEELDVGLTSQQRGLLALILGMYNE